MQKYEEFVIAAEICEDLWTPNPPVTAHAMHGATVLVNCSASNETDWQGIIPQGTGKGRVGKDW